MPYCKGKPGLLSVMILLTFLPDAVQAQCSRPTGEFMHLKEEHLSLTSFPEGSKAAFECDIGYTPTGYLSVVCLGDSWTPIQGECQKFACGTPGEVRNGWYDMHKGTEFGSVVEARCHEGHILVGTGRRVCMPTGWSNRVAVCEAVQCGPPPQVEHGDIVDKEESYSYGATVRYRCRGDLTLKGPPTVHCDKTGEFSPNPPTCIDVTCPDPVVQNAYLIESSIPPYKYRSYVTFECLEGYNMNGSSSLTCQIDSVWSASYPICVKEPEKLNVFWRFLKDPVSIIKGIFG